MSHPIVALSALRIRCLGCQPSISCQMAGNTVYFDM
jgi:hypothetical protein